MPLFNDNTSQIYPPHPGFVSGKYYSSNAFTNAAAMACVPGFVYYTYFFIPFAQTFSKLSFQVTTSIVDNAAVAIYSVVSGLPSQLVANLGVIAVPASSGIREISYLITLPAGWYAIGFTCSPNTINLLYPNNSLNNLLGQIAPTPSLYNGFRANLTYGNFPSTASLVNLVDFTAPFIWLKTS